MAKPDFARTDPISRFFATRSTIENYTKLGPFWFGHYISFEILLQNPQLECQSRQRFEFESVDFSTGCNLEAKLKHCVLSENERAHRTAVSQTK